MAVRKNMSWFRGMAYDIADTIKSGSLAENIAGWHFSFSVRRGYIDADGKIVIPANNETGWMKTTTDSSLVLEKSTAGGGITVDDPTTGVLTISVEANDTLGLSVGKYVYDVWRIDSGAEALLTYGEVLIEPAVKE